MSKRRARQVKVTNQLANKLEIKEKNRIVLNNKQGVE